MPHSIKIARTVSAALFLTRSSLLPAYHLLAWSQLVFPTLPAATILLPAQAVGVCPCVSEQTAKLFGLNSKSKKTCIAGKIPL